MQAMLLAAEIWTYWIGAALFLGSVAVVIAVVVGYLVRVEAPQYRGKKQ
jgi:hypothetical protein